MQPSDGFRLRRHIAAIHSYTGRACFANRHAAKLAATDGEMVTVAPRRCQVQASAKERRTAPATAAVRAGWPMWRRLATAARLPRGAGKVDGLPAGFRFHDLRHYYASLLISSGADVKVVQARLRHASAKTTLDTYAHLWPDTDDSHAGRRRQGLGGPRRGDSGASGGLSGD